MTITNDDNNVWWGTIDNNTWIAYVERTEPYRGTLTVYRVATNERIHTEPVSIAYDAKFGPDVDDVRLWQTMAITAIDAHTAEQP